MRHTPRRLDYWNSEGRRYVGHLVMLDHAQGPAVLLAHNTPGVDDFERGIARRLAGLGYVVLCVDYVGTGELLSMDQIHPRFGAAIADITLLRGAMTAGLEALIAQPSVDASRVAAIGHCLGGAAALELARSGADVAAVAVFHSTLPVTSGEQPEHQEQDPGPDRYCRTMTPAEVRTLFESKMNEAGVDWRMILTAVFRTHSPSPKH